MLRKTDKRIRARRDHDQYHVQLLLSPSGDNPWNVDGGRLQNLTTTRPADSEILQNSTYDYDAVGNIQTIVDSVNQSNPQTQTFTYDELDRLRTSTVTGGTNGIYTEDYDYYTDTGNLKEKGDAIYNTYSATHKHAVTSLSNGNTYGYDDNGNMTSRHVLDGATFKDFTLNYDAENRLVSVTGAATADFDYDADGKQVKATVNGVTTYYIGNHYEVKNSVVTKYYFAGATRIAVRTNGTLSYLLGDHLGSSSVTTDANGVKTASALYKAFGETRYTLGNLGTDYKFTGQREEASLGIYFFNARWMDPSLGRFTSPDTIVPTGTQGTQAWDRYAFVNNNPVRYNDPTGHEASSPDERDDSSNLCEEEHSDDSTCVDATLTDAEVDKLSNQLHTAGQNEYRNALIILGASVVIAAAVVAIAVVAAPAIIAAAGSGALLLAMGGITTAAGATSAAVGLASAVVTVGSVAASAVALDGAIKQGEGAYLQTNKSDQGTTEVAASNGQLTVRGTNRDNITSTGSIWSPSGFSSIILPFLNNPTIP